MLHFIADKLSVFSCIVCGPWLGSHRRCCWHRDRDASVEGCLWRIILCDNIMCRSL